MLLLALSCSENNLHDIEDAKGAKDTARLDSSDPVEDIGDGEPNMVLSPWFHDFGTLGPEATDSVVISVENTGDADLVIHELTYEATTTELSMTAITDLPWTLAPGAFRTTTVNYAPADATADEGFVTVSGNDPDLPWETASQVGNGASPETTWYIFDDGIHCETTSNAAYKVDSHGDPALYWYEPSGAHGLIDSTDPATDFDVLRNYVIDRSGGPTAVTGPLSWSSNSTLSTFAFATYTYVLCDFWVPGGDDPALYRLTSGNVDDGVQVMMNDQIIGRITLGQSGNWDLAPYVLPGQVNSIVVILVDDSASNRYLQNLVLARDGVIVN